MNQNPLTVSTKSEISSHKDTSRYVQKSTAKRDAMVNEKVSDSSNGTFKQYLALAELLEE
ncbi:hypothetical protein N480_10190 [Pseudoalteromonas luteoviolacea S2607]|uniref:hypothetical protein n=1 Tax=Pseudoalteromonas luteoviolacea TaxID=43657 RepID=UPI0007B082A5|nr:hypothetical protein [Pseudoalteromonas luteoviolacea]KZN28454.1 hypothetical protein N480_10190 [Pseudoalteromonas luteoviolacea S2607]